MGLVRFEPTSQHSENALETCLTAVVRIILTLSSKDLALFVEEAVNSPHGVPITREDASALTKEASIRLKTATTNFQATIFCYFSRAGVRKVRRLLQAIDLNINLANKVSHVFSNKRRIYSF